MDSESLTIGCKSQWNPTASTRYTPRQLARTTTQVRSRCFELRIRTATLPRLCEDYSLFVAAAGLAVQIVIGSVASCGIAGDADLSRKAQRNCCARANEILAAGSSMVGQLLQATGAALARLRYRMIDMSVEPSGSRLRLPPHLRWIGAFEPQ